MEAAGGNAVQAAKALGVKPIALYNVLHKTPELRIRWTRSKENNKPIDQAAAAINRPIEPVPVSDAEALQKANAQLKQGFEAIGLNGKKLEQAIAIQQFARREVKELMGFMAGSIAKQFTDIENEIEQINQTLAGFEKSDDEWVRSNKVLTVEHEEMLRNDRSKLYDLRIKSYDRAVKAQVAMAMLKIKATGGGKGKGDGRTAGFGPLLKDGRKDTPPPIEA